MSGHWRQRTLLRSVKNEQRAFGGFHIMLTDEQRAELEALTPEVVQIKLIQSGAGPGAAVQGFKSAPLGLTRSDVEAWLAENFVKETRDGKSTLCWAKIAGWTSSPS
jgi:hypothetical protein